MKNNTPQYIKCPRCELNYILKKDKFCDVCKSEMKAGILDESDFDEFDVAEGMRLCPVCKVNYISDDENMCVSCQEEQGSMVKDDEPDWRGFVDKNNETDDEDLDLLPVEDDDEIDEELQGAFAKDLDEEFGDDSLDEDEENDDDFEDDDDFDSVDDDDYDEEDDDYEDDYDDDDGDDDEDYTPKRRR